MNIYYSSPSLARLDEVCAEIREAFCLAAFRTSDEHELAVRAIAPEWEYAWTENQDMSLLVTRGEGIRSRPLDHWIPGFPQGATCQVVLTVQQEPPWFLEQLSKVLGTATECYSELHEVWSVRERIPQPIRFVRQSGNEYFAAFTLHLQPDPDQRGILFTSRVQRGPNTDWAPFVESGVRDFGFDWLRVEKPISGLHVTLSDLIEHPTDTKPWALHHAAKLAMATAMDQYGVKL